MNKYGLLKLYDLELNELIAKVEKLPFNRELEVCSIITSKLLRLKSALNICLCRASGAERRGKNNQIW